MRTLWMIMGGLSGAAGLWQRHEAGAYDAGSAALIVASIVLIVGAGILGEVRRLREK